MFKIKDSIQNGNLIEYKNAGIELKMEDGDLETLKAGTVDYIGFSYYSTSVATVKQMLKKQLLT